MRVFSKLSPRDRALWVPLGHPLVLSGRAVPASLCHRALGPHPLPGSRVCSVLVHPKPVTSHGQDLCCAARWWGAWHAAGPA